MKGILSALRHLAVIALFVRAMLPAGWMPDAHAGLVLCGLDNPGIVHLGVIHHDGGHPAGDDKTSHEECPFAAAPHLAAVPDVPVFLLPSLHAFAAATDRAQARVIAARFTPQSPRAPPRNA